MQRFDTVANRVRHIGRNEENTSRRQIAGRSGHKQPSPSLQHIRGLHARVGVPGNFSTGTDLAAGKDDYGSVRTRSFTEFDTRNALRASLL